ncbi:hypothetical protein SAMN04487911_1246 [Arenibacter nanhaiticus]|uniref:Uncharacterized protein n=1 Tax=Arenibacter nanhaiticus TaxID=558155 RepID=A0A1M6K0U4_9FLAO|nr:hypothetical protein SAMN04487911_1246 [Arenibacter nanhaiticus]
MKTLKKLRFCFGAMFFIENIIDKMQVRDVFVGNNGIWLSRDYRNPLFLASVIKAISFCFSTPKTTLSCLFRFSMPARERFT